MKRFFCILIALTSILCVAKFSRATDLPVDLNAQIESIKLNFSKIAPGQGDLPVRCDSKDAHRSCRCMLTGVGYVSSGATFTLVPSGMPRIPPVLESGVHDISCGHGKQGLSMTVQMAMDFFGGFVAKGGSIVSFTTVPRQVVLNYTTVPTEGSSATTNTSPSNRANR